MRRRKGGLRAGARLGEAGPPEWTSTVLFFFNSLPVPLETHVFFGVRRGREGDFQIPSLTFPHTCPSFPPGRFFPPLSRLLRPRHTLATTKVLNSPLPLSSFFPPFLSFLSFPSLWFRAFRPTSCAAAILLPLLTLPFSSGDSLTARVLSAHYPPPFACVDRFHFPLPFSLQPPLSPPGCPSSRR